MCSIHKRNAYIIVGKSLTNANRLEAEINYLPSKDQKKGTYIFIK